MGNQKPELVGYFLDLSVVLTGFSRFHLQGTGQTSLYFDTVNSVVGERIFEELLTTFHNLNSQAQGKESILTQGLRLNILGSEKLGTIARNIIKLWYLSTWYQLPQEWRDVYGTMPNDKTFIPASAAYPEGLLWPAVGVNPKGAKGQGYGTWSEPPLVTLDQK